MTKDKKKLKDIIIAEKIAYKVKEMGGNTYYVGGYVRDKILGIDNKDIDIEIHGIFPEQLEAILSDLGKWKAFGASFGVYGMNGYDIDIAMPRLERSTGNGHKDYKVSVCPFIGIKEAAKRRDLTINAMMEDVLTHQLADPYQGLKDIKKKIIRHVDADTFTEDPLRVLRAAGFAARLNFTVAPETIDLCKTIDLSMLSKERIYTEIEKVFVKSETPSVFFSTIRDMHRLDVWFPELEKTIQCEQNPDHHGEGNVWNHTMMVLDYASKIKNKAEYPTYFMFSALCHDFGKAVEGITKKDENGIIRSIGHDTAGEIPVRKFIGRITSEKKLTDYVVNMTLLHMKLNTLAKQNGKAWKAALVFSKSVCPKDLILLAEADHFGRKTNYSNDYSQTKQWILEKYDYYRKMLEKPVVTGDDLIKLNIPPSPAYAHIIKTAKILRLKGKTKEEQLEAALSDAKAKGIIEKIPKKESKYIGGDDLIRLGYTPSPRFGNILDKAKSDIDKGKTKKAVMDCLREYISNE